MGGADGTIGLRIGYNTVAINGPGDLAVAGQREFYRPKPGESPRILWAAARAAVEVQHWFGGREPMRPTRPECPPCIRPIV